MEGEKKTLVPYTATHTLCAQHSSHSLAHAQTERERERNQYEELFHDTFGH